MSSIVLLVFACVHVLAIDPCSQNNPITAITYLWTPDEIKARCVASIVKRASEADQQPRTGGVSLHSISGMPVDQAEMKRMVRQYGPQYFSDGRITAERLQKLPAHVKELCDSKCRALVKKQLQAEKGVIRLRPGDLPAASR